MKSTAKIIVVTSIISVAIASTAFYFLVWRKRKGVSKQDADMLKNYTVEEQPLPKDVAKALSNLPIMI